MLILAGPLVCLCVWVESAAGCCSHACSSLANCSLKMVLSKQERCGTFHTMTYVFFTTRNISRHTNLFFWQGKEKCGQPLGRQQQQQVLETTAFTQLYIA